MRLKKINALHDQDLKKIHSLSKTAGGVLFHLYRLPIVNVVGIMKITGYTKVGAQKVINRLIDLDILKIKNKDQKYDGSYSYNNYVEIFN